MGRCRMMLSPILGTCFIWEQSKKSGMDKGTETEMDALSLSGYLFIL